MRKRQGQFHIYLDNTVLERLKTLAAEEGRTITELIREAIAELLRKREKDKSKKVRE